jgi:hypothetical protein
MKCAKCSTEIPVQAAFCPNCGAKAEQPVPPANVCRQCQNPLPPNAQFCNKCGAPAGQPAVSASSACPQCNTLLKAGAVFCPNCGLKQQGAATPPPPYAQPYIPPYAPPVQAPYYAQPVPAPKKGHGGLVAFLVIVLVLAVAAGAFFMFKDKVAALFGGPKASYVNIESKELKKQAADAVDKMSQFSSGSVVPDKGGYDISLKMSLDENMPGVDPGTIAALENITINTKVLFDRKAETPKFYTQLDLMTGEEKLLTLEALYNQDQLVLGLPGILEKYISATSEELASMMGSTGVDPSQATGGFAVITDAFSMDLGIDKTKLNGTCSKIIDIMLKNVDEVEKKGGQPLTAGGVTAKYDLYTMTMSKENARTMVIEILEYLKTDEEVYNLASKISALAAESGQTTVEEMTLESYKQALDDAITDIKDDTSGEDFTLTQNIYVGKNNEVFGRELTATDGSGTTLFHFQMANPVSGSSEGLSISVESEGQAYTVAGSFTVSGEARTGSFDVLNGETIVATVSLTDFEQKTIDNKDYLLGEATITVEPSADTTYTGPSSFTYKGWMQDGKYFFSINMPGYFSIEIGYSDVPAGDVTFPSIDPGQVVSMSDQEALSGLMTEDAMTKLNEIVAKLGLFPTPTE